MRRGEAKLSDAQLQHAFNRLHRPGWPADLHAALAHPVCAAAIKGLARQLVREAAANSPKPTAPRPAGPDAAFIAKAMRAPFDSRRAAANDREDD